MLFAYTTNQGELAMGFGSLDNQIHVANSSAENIYVIVTPNKNWVWGDVGFAVATALFSGGGTAVTAVNSLSKLQKLITMVKLVLNNPIVKGIKYGSLIYKTGKNIGREIDHATEAKAQAARKEIMDFLKREGVVIKPGDFKQVNNEKNYNPFRMISPSGWGGLFGASDCTLFIATESLSRTALFNTNSDWSWIVQPDMVSRSRYGHLWQEDKGEGFYRFSASDRLGTGQFLKPNESISSPDRCYDFVYQEDGNAVVYERDKPDGEKPIWSSDTYNRPAWRTCIQNDGNFVVYENEKKASWASNVFGSDSKYEGCSLVMQDDGRLVVYNKDNEELWASKKK